MRYFPRLDGLRALAVSGVLIHHFLYKLPGVAALLPGNIGVRLFFVLSGFLITRILLDYRDRMTTSEAAATFYWRRFLRLAPPFYFAIAVAAILGVVNMREDWPWHALYLSNILFDFRPVEGVRPVGHLWSLAVEEQFYLLWFAVILLVPRRYILPAIIFAIVVEPVYRASGLRVWNLWETTSALGVGALLGWASINNERLLRSFGSWPVFWTSAALLLGSLIFYPSAHLTFPAMALFSASIVALAALPDTKGLDWLQFAPLRDMGKISYGIYLYHAFLPPIFALAGVEFPHYYLRAAVLICLSVAVAALSWFLIEAPALRLKDSRLWKPKPLIEPA